MKYIKYILASLIIIIYTGRLTAQSELDNYLKDVYSNHVIPGFSVVVVKNGRVFFTKGYGVECLGSDKKFTPYTVSAIGSLTKSFTALAVMQLVEKGKIELDKRVIDYIPWFKTANKDKSDKITVRMLLNNTSGLYGGVNPSFDFTNKALENLAHTLEGVYIINEPGKSFEYSNVAFSVAGLLVSTVTGQKYGDYLEENIFKPLKMIHTSVDPERFNSLNSIYGHYFGISKAIPAQRNKDNESGEFIPAGSITRSCSTDLANYLLFLLEGGRFEGKNIISKEGIQKMWEPNISFYGLSKDDGGEDQKTSYCLGWMSTTIEDRKIIFHPGSTGTMSSCTMIDVKNNTAASILMNIDISFIDKYRYKSDLNILNNVIRLASGLPKSGYAIPVVPDPTLNSFELNDSKQKSYTGNYKFQHGDNFVFQGAEVEIMRKENQKLELTATRGSQVIFKCNLDFVNESFAINRNLSIPASIRFKTNSEGKITGLFMNGSEFVRLSTVNNADYKTVSGPDYKFKFEIPSGWIARFESSGITVSDNNGIDLLIKANEPLHTTFDGFFKNHSGDEIIKTEGVECSQTYGNQVWQQLTIVAGNKEYIIFSTNVRETKFFAMFSIPDGRLTKEIQNSISKVIESLILSPVNS